jgi:hypothetical protein
MDEIPRIEEGVGGRAESAAREESEASAETSAVAPDEAALASRAQVPAAADPTSEPESEPERSPAGPRLTASIRQVDPRRLREGALSALFATAVALCLVGSAPLLPMAALGPSEGRPTPPDPSSGATGGVPATSAWASGIASGPSAAPSLSPLAIPTQTAPTARIVFSDLVVDSTADRSATKRTFTFLTDGPGLVAVDVVASSPTDSTTLCLSADGSAPVCATGATPGFPRAVATTAARSRWTATLISTGNGSPTVDVEFRWPTLQPWIILTHGRFEGQPNRDSLRTLTATFTARYTGPLSVDADWMPETTTGVLTLYRVESAGVMPVRSATYADRQSMPTPFVATLSGGTYRLALANDGGSLLRPDFSATIEFP